MTTVIAVDNLSRYYGPRLAVDRVSFQVNSNEVMGLLGPNGSGKSTILRILAGYLRPTAGTATIAGHDVVADGIEARRRLGYVPEDIPLYSQMRVGEFLAFMGRLRGQRDASLRGAIDEVVELLSLGSVRSLLIGKLSRGYRQRVAIAQALLGKPEALVLDEPTNGLDPRQIIELRELIRRLARKLSILVTSHILAEVERIAHRIAILLDGKLLAVHALNDALPAASRVQVRLRVSDEARTCAALTQVAGVGLVEVLPDRGHYILDAPAGIPSTVAALVHAGFEIEEISAWRNLESLFLQLTEGTKK